MKTTDLLPPELSEIENEADILLEHAAQLERAAQALDLEPVIVQRLKHPEREITLNLPLLRQQTACTAFRVQHANAIGPCLGPLLLSPDSHLRGLRALAVHTSLQCALLRLPLSGSAGALVCDPEQLTETELRQLIQDYVFGLRGLIGPTLDVIASPDFAAACALRAHRNDCGQSEPAAVVNKPAALGGLPDPPAASAVGLLALIDQMLHEHKRELPGSRIAIQGLGPVCRNLAARLYEAGARMIAVADKSGGLWRETGIHIPELLAHVGREAMLFGFQEAEAVRNSEVLEADCDLLITAAAPRQINLVNAARIRAPLVIEATHQAVTPQADCVLHERGIEIAPELLGTAPRTLAWFAEWQHGIRYATPEQPDVERFIHKAMTEAFRRVRQHAREQQLSLRRAASMLAVDAFATVLRLRS
ncbi:MAG: Glu/Leu/Phe/Val family dehydrogenase [Terriglobales bacterium]